MGGEEMKLGRLTILAAIAAVLMGAGVIYSDSLVSKSIHDLHDHDESTNWSKDQEAYRSARWVGRPEFVANDIDYPKIAIDPAQLKIWLEELSGMKEVTVGGKKVKIRERSSEGNRELARQYLANRFESWGYRVVSQKYRSGENFVAELQGKNPEKVLILSAHLDSVGNAGANDDGTGIVALMAIAEKLAKKDFEISLRFVGFDQEERGLIGSRAYVQSLDKKIEVVGDIQMEMMGTNSRKDGAFHVIDCKKGESPKITEHIMNAVTQLKLPLNRVEACTTRSDHKHFWDKGIPAVVLSENFFGRDADKCYHRSCDIVDGRLNFEYMANIVRAVGSATQVLLNQ